jgi:RNA polymerase sigma-B factor
VEFSTYATPTILGEVKRWFRDKGWAIRVPRRLQELRMSISRVTTDLTQRLGRSPTISELAKELDVDDGDVLDALESGTAYNTVSLDAPDSPERDTHTTLDTLGEEDAALERVENREALSAMLAELPERERRIVMLRFFSGMTQSQIATEIGISQMHVSRLLSRSLVKLRTGLSPGST